ncbi:MAG: hypothetical protein M1426_03985 [Patescibacteria group bacterium]|nr:hypothetical protein [Patescibacteria group bacterium]
MSITQKWDHFYNYMYKIRFPGWSQIEDKLRKEIVKMELPDKIKLSYPEYLEGNELQFHIHFSSPEELKSVGEKIINISNSETIRSILQWIK